MSLLRQSLRQLENGCRAHAGKVHTRGFAALSPDFSRFGSSEGLLKSEPHPDLLDVAARAPIAAQTDFYVNEALQELDYPARLQKLLLSPQRIVCAELTIAMDDCETGSFHAWRVQHDNSRGPFKGGFRFHRTADLSEAKSLASLMTWKTAIMQLPFGGAKGGVVCDPTLLSERELERLTRKLVQSFKDVMGPFRDIPGPEISTGSKVMSWFFDEYSKYRGYTPACITGKPVHLHGTHAREYATGRGVMLAIRELLKAINMGRISGKTFAIQGFGNVGSWAAELINLQGGKVIAVSDRSGVIMNEKGLNITSLRRHMKAQPPWGGHLTSFPEATSTRNLDILTIPCDVLIPAAIGGVINKDNADKLKCRVVVEAANGPTTPEADQILRDRGIYVLPDVYASAGGVTVSFFEWVQNLQQLSWEEYEVNNRLDRAMTDAFDKLWTGSQYRRLPLRTAAYVQALETVVEAHRNRGFD